MTALLTRLALGGLILITLTDALSAAEDRTADAEHVLQAAGLKRSKTSYVLPEEADVIKLEGSIAKLQQRLNDLSKQYQSQEAQIQNEKQAAANERIQGRVMRNPGYAANARNNGMRANQHQQQANRIKQQAAQPEKDLKKQQGEYQQKAQKLMKQYADLATKPEIKQALRTINRNTHPKYVLGPASKYRENVIALSTATLTELGYKIERDQAKPGHERIHLAEDADLLKDLNKALDLASQIKAHQGRLEGAGAASSKTATSAGPATAKKAEVAVTPEQLAEKRAELAPKVPALRDRIKELQQRRETLTADGEAQDYVDELNRLGVSKKKLELGTYPGLEVAIQKFQKIDEGLEK